MSPRGNLHVLVDRVVLLNFRRAIEDLYGTLHGKIGLETEAALKAWTKNLRARGPIMNAPHVTPAAVARSDLNVLVDRTVLLNFRRAIEDVWGTRRGKIALETEAALRVWPKNLKDRDPPT